MIVANFENDTYKRVTGLWQWDYGQVLRIQGLNLPKAVEIHFSLQESGGEAKKRVGFTKDGVTDVVIPESMLENEEAIDDYNAYAFVYLTDDASGQTEYKICMPVKARPKPEAFDKPEDGEIFREAIKAVNDAAERAESAEKQAGKYAEQTKADAQKTTADRQEVEKLVESVSGISEQVETVKGYAEQTQTAATNASLSEQKSNEAKEAAVQAQGRTETAADEAEQHATEAAGDKTEVERLATQVRQDKTSVEQTVQGFENTVQQAEQSINTAKTKAVKAVQTEGTTQTGNVTAEGKKQVQEVQAKGQQVINSIPEDFTTQMATKLDKQQGTENAGKSLVIGDDGNVVPGEPTQQIEVDKTLTQEGQAADAKATGDKILQYAIKVTASGESIVLTDSAEEKLLDFTMQGKTEQTTTTGKNLFDVSKSQPGYYQGAQGNLIEYDENFSVSDFIQISDAQNKLCISPLSESTASFVVIFNENKEKIYSDNNSSIASRKGVIDIPTGAKYIRFSSRGIENVQAEYSDTPTDYEPYTGGKPSPSVEYPQEIVNAGDSGQIEVKVTGKNLFDISKLKSGFGAVKIDGNKITLPIGGAMYFNSIKNICPDLKVGDEVYIFADSTSANKNVYLYPQSGLMPLGNKITIKSLDDQLLLYGDNSKISTITNLMFTKVNDKTYETYKEPQTLTIQLDRPITKWDKIEKRDGVWGVAYKSKTVDDLSNLITGREIIYGNVGSKYFTIAIAGANFNYDKTKVFSEVGVDNGNYTPKINTGSFIIGINDTDTIETAKEHMHYKVIYETDAEEFVPLPQETQTALNALHTYYPTTVMSNSEDCEMEVTYVCDTKNYIDNKISENVESVISQYQTNVVNLLSLMPLSVQAGMVENDTNNILENVEEMKHE